MIVEQKNLLRQRFCSFVDIGANLTDGMFQGVYNGSQKHPNDLDIVLNRSWSNGLAKIIITVGTITDTEDAAKIAQKDGMIQCVLLSSTPPQTKNVIQNL